MSHYDFTHLPQHFQQLAAELYVFPHDIEEHFTRGGGHGGQKINKTSSCVELRHVPTGIMVRCQQHRAQSRNRVTAFEILLLKIEEHQKGEESRLARERFKVRKQKQRRTRRSKEKILADKHHRGAIKDQRGSVTP